MIEIHKKSQEIHIVLNAIAMGKDWTVTITGGEVPHLGAIALGIPRPSLKDRSRISATVSVLTLTGHKEDELARPAAHFLSSSLNVPIVVSCGIHNNNIKPEDISLINDLVQEALDDFVKAVQSMDR